MSKETCQLPGTGISSNKAVISARVQPASTHLIVTSVELLVLVAPYKEDYYFLLPTSWSSFKKVTLGLSIETQTCWIHRFSFICQKMPLMQMKLPNILGRRIDFSKTTAIGVTDSCVMKDTEHPTSSCQKLLADFQEKLLNFQEGKLQLRKKQNNSFNQIGNAYKLQCSLICLEVTLLVGRFPRRSRSKIWLWEITAYLLKCRSSPHCLGLNLCSVFQ